MWVAAAAKAALQVLLDEPFNAEQQLNQGSDRPSLQVPVCSAAPLAPGEALGISRCDPGPGLDLTRDLEVWVRVAWIAASQPLLELQPGEGVGRFGPEGDICLSGFARELLERNLLPLLPPGRGLMVQPILPRGRSLAQRTSNAAFGVVDGLALIGTQAEVQRSAAPDQLQEVLAELEARAADPAFQGRLVLVIGENGLDLARQQGLVPVLKVGNWVGPVLVAAAEAGVRDLLLLGYHGKLIKLAGGIFHTHHHLADGRLEVLVALGWMPACRRLNCCNVAAPPRLRRPFRCWMPIKPGHSGSIWRRWWSGEARPMWIATAPGRCGLVLPCSTGAAPSAGGDLRRRSASLH